MPETLNNKRVPMRQSHVWAYIAEGEEDMAKLALEEWTQRSDLL